MELELERLNRDGSAPPEERSDGRGGRLDCGGIHTAVSRWMLPEDARAAYLARANCRPPPLFIAAISVAELAVFVYYAVWKPPPQWLTVDPSLWDSPLIYSFRKREEAWRFVSYMLVHAGIEHILGNLVLQLCLGIPLELVHKGLRVGLVYMAGVIGGSLASSVFDPQVDLVGASGGVYALIGGYFMNVLVNFREMIPLFGVARLLLIFTIVGTDVGFALYRRFLSPAVGLKWRLGSPVIKAPSGERKAGPATEASLCAAAAAAAAAAKEGGKKARAVGESALGLEALMPLAGLQNWEEPLHAPSACL